MAYYVQKLHRIEILKMVCEFLKDETGSIWFSYAHDITSRPVKDKYDLFGRMKKLNYINKEH